MAAKFPKAVWGKIMKILSELKNAGGDDLPPENSANLN